MNEKHRELAAFAKRTAKNQAPQLRGKLADLANLAASDVHQAVKLRGEAADATTEELRAAVNYAKAATLGINGAAGTSGMGRLERAILRIFG